MPNGMYVLFQNDRKRRVFIGTHGRGRIDQSDRFSMSIGCEESTRHFEESHRTMDYWMESNIRDFKEM